MKLYERKNRKAQAFTLIEMIGVLAVIAILAALLIPKIFEAINNARINNCVVSYNTIKTATMDHYGKYGKINSLFGTNDLTAPITNYDKTILMPEAMIDKPFAVRIGGGDPATNSVIQAVAAAASGGAAGYDLDGNGSPAAPADVTGAQFVVEAVVYNVAAEDALAVSQRLDGQALSETLSTTADTRGRVRYVAPSSGTVSALYLYIAHR
jgi:prepilin-type N-terminal cleavage/methylation domain-containing protein